MSFLDHQLLLRSEPPAIVSYLRNTLRSRSEEQLTQAVLTATDVQLIPSTVASLLLPVVREPACIRQALTQNFSVSVRRAAIRRIGKLLKTKRWHNIWAGLGGTQGYLDLFAELSVQDVSLLASMLGSSSRSHPSQEKEAAVTELFESLLPQYFPEARLKNHDERGLDSEYMSMLGACSEQCVEFALERISVGVREKQLLFSHSLLLQKLARQSLHENPEKPKFSPYMFNALMQDVIPRNSPPKDLSAPMDFSMRVLRDVVHGDGSPERLPERMFLIYEKLLRKAIHKHFSSRQKYLIIQSSIDALKKFPKLADEINIRYSDYLLDIAERWSRTNETEFLDQLLTLIQLSNPPKENTLDVYIWLLERVSRRKRYTLLKKLVWTVSQVDLESSQAADDKVIEDISFSVLKLLQPGDAILLLERWMQIRPACDFVRFSTDRVSNCLAEPNTAHADCNMVMAYLRHGDETSVDICQSNIEERKTKATRSKDQQTRSWYGQSVLCYAILSGSIGLYKNVLDWTKRFLKDPVTMKELYSEQVISTGRATSLLAGIPNRFTARKVDLTPATVRSRVAECNEVIKLMFETMLLAQREPSFQAYNWRAVFNVLPNVVKTRIQRVYALSDKLEFSEREVYDSVWRNTVELLLDIEKQSLAPGHEKLKLNHPSGLLRFMRGSMESLTPSALRFIDELARSRDQLWQHHRPTVHPAVASLRAPFPRGLPIQSLFSGLAVRPVKAPAALTYLASRAQSIVFMTADSAFSPIPEDEDEQAAIGAFKDDYIVALRVAVALQEDDARKQYLDNAWKYAVEKLLPCRDLSAQKATFIRRTNSLTVFKNWEPPSISAQQGTQSTALYPVLPRPQDPPDVDEWNPCIAEPSSTEDKTVMPNLFSSFVYVKGPDSINDEFIRPHTHSIKGKSPLGVWNLHRFHRRVPAEVAEGLILSALLYLDSKKPSGPRELADPFPSQKQVRYPALYLDAYFLDKKNLNEDAALDILEEFSSRVPPLLLARLAENALKAAEGLDGNSTQLATAERTALRLLKMLATCNRPSLASRMVVDIVVNRQDLSSWHRQLLTGGHFDGLKAKQAQDMITALVTRIESRLEQASQAHKRRKTQAEEDTTSRQPLLKISTIKMVAQLLGDADFVAPLFKVRALRSLFTKARSIDVRAAVVSQLLSMLRLTSDDVREEILATLELCRPVIAAVNEAQPLSEKDWQSLEQKQELPEVFSDNPREIPPVMSALLGSLSYEVFERVLLPAMQQSRANNQRWLQLVCTTHGKPIAAANNSAVSFSPQVLANLLSNHQTKLPASVLHEYHRHIMINMSPPQEAAEVTQYFWNDKDLRTLPEGKVWLDRFDQGVTAAIASSFAIPHALCRPVEGSLRRDGITVETLRRYAHEQIVGMIGIDTNPSCPVFDTYLANLQPPYQTSGDTGRQRWNQARPVVEFAIRQVQALRTPAWPRDAARQPPYLPDTLKWQTWLLPYPHLVEGVPDDRKAVTFAQALRKMLVDLLNRRRTYHAELDLFRQAAMRAPDVDRPVIAVHLGSLSTFDHADSTLCLLCVEIADYVLGRIATAGYETHVVGQVRTLLDEWAGCEIEAIRVGGFASRGRWE